MKNEKNINKYRFIEMSQKQYIIGLIMIPMYIILFRLLVLVPLFNLLFGKDSGISFLLGPIKTVLCFIVLIICFRNVLVQSVKELIGSRLLYSFRWILFSFLIYIGTKVIFVIVSMILKSSLSEFFWWLSGSQAANQITLNEIRVKLPVVYYIFTVLIAPVVEELIFRYILYHWLRKINTVVAIIVSSLLFAGLHVIGYLGEAQYIPFVYYFLDYLAPAVLITVLYEKRRNIIICMILHSLINIVANIGT